MTLSRLAKSLGLAAAVLLALTSLQFAEHLRQLQPAGGGMSQRPLHWHHLSMAAAPRPGPATLTLAAAFCVQTGGMHQAMPGRPRTFRVCVVASPPHTMPCTQHSSCCRPAARKRVPADTLGRREDCRPPRPPAR